MLHRTSRSDLPSKLKTVDQGSRWQLSSGTVTVRIARLFPENFRALCLWDIRPAHPSKLRTVDHGSRWQLSPGVEFPLGLCRHIFSRTLNEMSSRPTLDLARRCVCESAASRTYFKAPQRTRPRSRPEDLRRGGNLRRGGKVDVEDGTSSESTGVFGDVQSGESEPVRERPVRSETVSSIALTERIETPVPSPVRTDVPARGLGVRIPA